MNIDLKKELINLNGEKLMHDGSPLTIGRAMAIALSTHQDVSDKLRAYVLSQTLYTKDEIELNTSDLSFVKDALTSSKTFFPLVLGQLLEILSEK